MLYLPYNGNLSVICIPLNQVSGIGSKYRITFIFFYMFDILYPIRYFFLKKKSVGECIMTKKTRKYEDSLIGSLKDPVEAAAYLSVHLEDNSLHAEETFLLALQDVAKAYGISEVAKKAKVGRESLYKTLSGSVNPKLSTLKKLLDTVGLKITIELKETTAS